MRITPASTTTTRFSASSLAQEDCDIDTEQERIDLYAEIEGTKSNTVVDVPSNIIPASQPQEQLVDSKWRLQLDVDVKTTSKQGQDDAQRGIQGASGHPSLTL